MVISVSIFIFLFFGSISTERKFRNAPIATSVKTGVNFDCPEEFGYYPHPNDCTQYYVCVFGGALLESCTGGLMYSHELQTCDWPRNVGCDGVDGTVSVSGPSASYASYNPPGRSKERGRERVREDTRTRYSPPPPPPPPAQPAAVVTSRGQPRNLQQTQQEIIKRKQQQQLYAEADETIPPAEEIENDRQQRVYRGQPSTIGQVQRDRDGLRHSNAISPYSGRGDKIGVISFGTQNQHYRLMSDDDLLLKHMTTKRRQKRQIRKSRPPEMIDHIRRQGTEKTILDFIQFQHVTERPFHKKKFSFNPSAPIDNNEEEFQPFTPSYQKNENNYQYIAFGKWADSPHRTSTISYRNTYSTTNHPTSRRRNRYPNKYNPYPIISDYSQVERYKVPNQTQNLQTQAIVAPYRIKTDVKDKAKYNFVESKNTNNRTHGKEFEQFQAPTEYVNKNVPYPNIKDLFSDPDFDFEAFFKKFKYLTTTSTENPKIDITVISTMLKDNISEISTSTDNYINITNVPVETKIKEKQRNNHKNYYTGTIQDKINDNKLTSKSNNSGHERTKEKSTKVTENKYNIRYRPSVKANKLNESDYSDYYYYDEYEDYIYPDKTKYNKNNDYLYYYDDEYIYPDIDIRKKEPTLDKIKNVGAIETFKININHSSSTTINPLSNTQLTSATINKNVQESSTTPKTRRTTRRIPSRATRRPYTSKRQGDIFKSRQTTTQTYDNNTKSHQRKNSQSEEKNVSPQQAIVSTVTAPTRNIYNSSQYNDNRYDPYYALYEDDVEIYRDEYPSNENTYSNEHSPPTAYRGTSPVSTVTPSSIRNEIPRRGNTAYIENNINPQEIYQQSTVSDYASNNNNKYETQDDQNTYKQNNRQQPYRGDRNELNDVEEVTTKRSTKRTTTTTRKPTTTTRVTTTTTIPTQKSTQLPLRSQTTDQNQSIAETLVHIVSPETQSYDTYEPFLPSTYLNIPNTNITENITFVILDHDSQYPQYISTNVSDKLNVDSESQSTSDYATTVKNKPSFHYITKTSATTSSPSTSSIITITKSSSSPEIKNVTRNNSINKQSSLSQNIVPTTYSPYRFVLRTPNSKPVFVQTTPTTNNWRSSELESYTLPFTYQNTNSNNLKAYKALKAVRKILNPVSLNHELTSPIEKAKEAPTEYQKDDEKQMLKLKYFISDHRIGNEKFVPTGQNKERKSTSTTTTEVTASETTTKQKLEENDPTYDENVATIKAKVVPFKDYTIDVKSIARPQSDPFSKKEPKPFSKPVITTTTKTHFLQNDSLPTRTSRVNAAIKSLINLGETRGSNKNKEGLIFPSKNYSKPRTPARGRGSVQYSGAGDQITNNEVIVTNNRGTPPTRSRPTLKPSTSIVSKAQEFVDIYKYPPRRPDPIYPQPQVDKTAAKCRKDVCLLPDCSCGGKEIPGDLPVEQVPQIILMTFDDSVNDLNKGLYQDLFEKGRTNPNGCPIAATFYVSHEWTDYSQVQNLYADGHELASHTVSHSFGEQFSQKKWTREVAGQREILAAYGGVHLEDVRGMRAPFLSVGGNKMFKMLYDSNFTYDSSMPIYENKPPSFPYTLDYKLFHDCMIPPCPTRSYPGVWEVPMVMWQDLNGGRCSMGDACSNPPDADGVFKMLMKNFMRHYTTNRAPFGLFYHAAWFTQPHHKEGFIKFVDTVLAQNDVWFLTNWQAIQWVRDPTPISRLSSFQPFQCNYADRPKRCNNPKVCNLWHKSGVRYMRTCQPCPDIYPWTGNSGIRSSKIDNDIGD